MGRVPLIYLESPANPTNALVDVAGGRPRPRRLVRRRASARRSRSTTPSSARSGTSRCSMAPTSSVYSLTKYAGGHSDLVAGGITGSKDADQHDPDAAQHDRHDHRSQHRLDAAAQPRDAGAAHDPRRRECRQGLRASCAIIPRSRASAISASSRTAATPARPTSTAATAPAPARPSRSISRAARGRPSPSSTR